MWLDTIGEVDRSLFFYIFCAVSAVNVVLALGLVILGCILRNYNSPGGSMDFYIAFGGLATIATVLVKGVSNDYLNDTIRDAGCQFYPMLLTFGLCWMIGGLLLRTSSIFGFYRTAEAKKVSKQEWKPNLWMVFLMLVNAAAVFCWVFLFPVKTQPSDDDDTVTCDGDQYETWKMALSGYYAFLLLLTAIMCWPALYVSRKTPSSTDSNVLSVVVYNFVFAVLAGALVFFFYDTTNTFQYLILGGLTEYSVFFTLLMLLITKIVTARRARGDEGDGHYARVRGDKFGNGEKFNSSERPSSDIYLNDTPNSINGSRECIVNNETTFAY